MIRKARAARRRADATAAAARMARADATLLFGGRPSFELARRHTPVWPSARSPRDFFQRTFPEAAAFAVAEADQALEGRLRLFGALEDVARGPGLLDWEHRPKDERAETFGADPKFPWEVARHAILPRLGVAWAVTRDARYAERAAVHVLDWTGRYSEPRGLHWSSALEVGIRLIAWCQAFHFFRSASAFKSSPIEALLRHVAAMATWLDGHLSTDRVVAGNHLLGELAGLVVADLYFPEMGEGARLGRNLALFASEVERQVAPDGVSREQSATYGRFVADFVAAVLAAARTTGAGVPAGLTRRAAALAVWLAALTREDGTLPLTGDNDNGKGVDWGEPHPSNDARGVILALAALVEDPAALAFPGTGRSPLAGSETAFWWTGEEGIRRIEALRRQARARRALVVFPDGGHAMIRHPDAPGADFVHVRCGPFGLGLPKPSAHSHADWMAPVVTLGGREILVDPGNFGYTTAGGARDLFRTDDAHSVFRVAGHALAVPGETFRWLFIPRAGRLEATETENEIRITGRWSPAPAPADKAVACARTLVYNKMTRALSIEDEWTTGGAAVPHGVVWRWHLPPEASVVIRPEGAGFETALPGGARFVFELHPPAVIRVENGWVAPGYSRRRPAPVVVVERAALNATGGRQVTGLVLSSRSQEVST